MQLLRTRHLADENVAMADATPPRRRWFQFSLGTWFVLTAIVAWGLVTRPYFVPVLHMSPIYVNSGTESWIRGEWHQTETLFGATFAFDADGEPGAEESGLNPRLRWPLFAFAGFVAWKTARRLRAW